MVCDSLCTNSKKNLQLWKVHFAYEWVSHWISTPLFPLQCHLGHRSLENIIEIRIEFHRLRQESHIIFNVVQRAHVLKMQIFVSFGVAARRNVAGKKNRPNIFYSMLRHRGLAASRWCRSSSKTTRENNNKLGSFQWKYIMTTSSRNWSYIRVSLPNEMAVAAYATSCSMLNPTKR